MTLLIVGASTRAAAQSARRAGFEPFACDLFADRDLAAMCGEGRAIRIPPGEYPSGFEAIAAQLAHDPGPWMYTGAMENQPELVDRMAEIRPLWGITGASLRSVRDPLLVSESLAERGLLAAPASDAPHGLPRDGSWLVKPKASAGGRGIVPLREETSEPIRPSYYQQKVDGLNLSAVYVGYQDGARLIGVTRQRIGREGEPFAYIGSVGPWPISNVLRREIRYIGDCLTRWFGLKGIFGVDLIVQEDDRPVLIEVNPRYPASAEVLELAIGRSVLIGHQSAFDSAVPIPKWDTSEPSRYVAKMILFADRSCSLEPGIRWHIRPNMLGTFAVPTVADVPIEGMTFEPGDPVLTVLSHGRTHASCEAKLTRRLARWRARLR